VRLHRLGKNFCPFCDQLLDGHTSLVDADAPRPGDFTLCGYCRFPLRFYADVLTGQLKIRPLSEEEIGMFDALDGEHLQRIATQVWGGQ
jgi:hypothetical protein